jgi:hypothetical protein
MLIEMDEVIRKSREKRIAQMKTERSQRLAQAKAARSFGSTDALLKNHSFVSFRYNTPSRAMHSS